MKTTKKAFALILCFMMLLSLLPAGVCATGKEQVYISVSYDGRYIEDQNNQPIAYVPVAFDQVASVDLAEYGLEEYLYDQDGDGNYETTALQLVIYAHEAIYGGSWDDVTFTGGAGSSYFQGGIFGFDENLNYYLNGEYPLAFEGWGATSDQIVLKAGDYLDIGSFSSWDFFSDSGYGFHFFADSAGSFTHNYTAQTGTPLSVKLVRSFSGMGAGAAVYDEPYYDVYYGTSLYEAAGTVTTDDSGCCQMTFDSAGTWYLWCDGGYGYEFPDSVVSTPAYAQVTVTAQEEPAKLFDLKGMNMSLGNSLSANFVVDKSDLDGSGYYAVITKAYADREPVTVTIPMDQWKDYGSTGYYFTFSGVSAKEMTDLITVDVYNGDGEQVMNTYNRTIEDYCYDQLVKEEGKEAPSAKDLALYVDILKYGAAAQSFFDHYHADQLATDRLSPAQLAYGANIGQMTDIRQKGAGYLGSMLSLKNEISLNFVFSNAIMEQADYATVSFTNHYGVSKESTVEAARFLNYGETGQYIPVNGMAVADCSQPVTVALYDAQGNLLSSSQDSVEAYICRMHGTDAVYSAILNLAATAYNYFH